MSETVRIRFSYGLPKSNPYGPIVSFDVTLTVFEFTRGSIDGEIMSRQKVAKVLVFRSVCEIHRLFGKL